LDIWVLVLEYSFRVLLSQVEKELLFRMLRIRNIVKVKIFNLRYLLVGEKIETTLSFKRRENLYNFFLVETINHGLRVEIVACMLERGVS